MPGPYFDALSGTSMPQGALQTAAMGPGPGGGVSSPRGTPLAVPPPALADPNDPGSMGGAFGGPAMADGTAAPGGEAAPMPGLPPEAGGMPSPGGPAAPSSALPVQQYGTQTQLDGSILLYMKMADGSPGPVVQVIPPPKQSKPPGGGK